MNLSFKLALYREYKKLEPENVAAGLNISLDLYTAIEKGRSKIDGILAQKLSDFYQAPVEFFLTDHTPYYLQAEVIYTNCTIISGDGGVSGYINHQYNDRGIDEVIQTKNEEIKLLKIHIEKLIQQNERLIAILGYDRKK
ncbi:MAG: helix-turn-helix transcriptional regulator [Chitinophagaceae bacterium]|nr:helix-turn-helix transcriptional regulator [Chitinophagaceae bacterium]